MKTAIILHGMPGKEEYYDPASPSPSNNHWIPWAQHELIMNEILAQAPELPMPYAPEYKRWLSVFEQLKIDEDTTLIGHSCGGGFLVRWLSENKVSIDKLVLVAPWIDPVKWLSNGMFDFKIDPSLTARTKGVTIFIDRTDYHEVVDSADLIHKTVTGSKLIEMTKHGHFTNNGMGTEEFPELIKSVLE